MTATAENQSIPTRPRRPAPPSKLSNSGQHAESAAEVGDEPPDAPDPAQHLEEELTTDDTGISGDEIADADGVYDMAVSWVEGDAVEIIPGDDPFTSTLSLIAEAEQLGVWVRLTPTAIQAITAELADVLALQQQALGMPSASAAHDESDEQDSGSDLDGDNPDEGEDDGGPREGMIRRVRDPIGLRFIPSRSSHAVWYIAGAVLLMALVAAVLSKVNL